MIGKILLRRGFLVLLMLLVLTGMVFAEGTLYISKTEPKYQICNFDNAAMDPATAKIEFYIGSIPAPNSTAGLVTLIPDKIIEEGNDVKFIFDQEAHKGLLYVRIWDQANNAYNSSSAGYAVDNLVNEVSMNLTFPAPGKYYLKSLKAKYKAETPPAPPIVAVHEGYDPQMRPLLKVSIGNYMHPNHELSAPNYEYHVLEGASAVGPWVDKGSVQIDSAEWRPDPALFDPITITKYYKFETKAHNWYGYSAVPSSSNIVQVNALASGTTLDPGTITLRNGINFISMPFNRKEGQIAWYAYYEENLQDVALNTGSVNPNNKIESPKHLITAINNLANVKVGIATVASTFGRWQTSDAGVLIPNKNLGQVTDAQSLAILNNTNLLRSEEGYQVYISGLGDNDTLILKIYSQPLPPKNP